MSEHFCEEHQVEFFKTNKMPNFAHPIEGTKNEKGKSKWCNMPEVQAAHPSTFETVSPAEPGSPLAVANEMAKDEQPPLVKEAKKLGAEVIPSDPKNRSYALSYAKDVAVATINKGKELSTDKVIEVAKRFARYLDTGA